MNTVFFIGFWEALLLVASLSLDTFVASFAYGAAKIKVPLLSALIINIICTAMFAVSLLLGSFLAPYISPEVIKYVSFSILLLLGIIKLFGGLLKLWIEKKTSGGKEVKFTMFDIRLILRVAGDSLKADKDENKILTVAEAATLAAALSIDGLAAGFSAGITSINPVTTIIISFAMGLLALFAGIMLGRILSKKINIELSWLAGLILIVLAVLRLF